MSPRRHDELHDHVGERVSLAAKFGASLRRILPPESVPLKAREAMLEAISDLSMASYDMGRRHAMCEIITNAMGPEHPLNGEAYAIDVRIAEGAERKEAMDVMRRLLEGHIRVEPPTGDERN